MEYNTSINSAGNNKYFYNTDLIYKNRKSTLKEPELFNFNRDNGILDDLIKIGINLSSSAKKEFKYELGKRDGDVRIVDTNSISERIKGKKGKNDTKDRSSLENPNGKIEDSGQGKRGDCYLLAAINSIRNTENGQETLTSNLEWHEDGSVTVTLPGAVKIREEYKKEGKECEVTGKYHITKAALDKAKNLAGDSYSKSDIEVIVFEIAMENYRAEMSATNKINGTEDLEIDAPEKTVNPKSTTTNDYLSGGFSYDAGYMLTGEKSDVYMADKQKRKSAKLYKQNEYGYITREELERRTNSDNRMYAGNKYLGATSEINNFTMEEKAVNKMLDEYKGREDELAICCGVIVGYDGPDGSTKAGGGHALTIVKITNSTIYVSNPWYPDKIEPIPRKDFLKMCTALSSHEVNSDSEQKPKFARFRFGELAA